MSNVDNTAMAAWSSATTANTYNRTRPNYNYESVKFLLEKMGVLKQHDHEFVVVELGAGTGKFTKAMIKVLKDCSITNVKIIATEPIKEMCEKIKENVTGVDILQCQASQICLPDKSADVIIAAQCFHWFSNQESVTDIHRVLKTTGILGIIWNMPDRTIPYINTIEEMLEEKFMAKNIPRPDRSLEWLVQINQHDGFGPLNEYDNYKLTTKHLTWEDIYARYTTYSVIAGANDSDKEKMLTFIKDILKTIPKKDGENYLYNYNVLLKWFEKK